MNTSTGTPTAAVETTDSAAEQSTPSLATDSWCTVQHRASTGRVADRTSDNFTAAVAPTTAVRSQAPRVTADADACIARFQEHGDATALEMVMAEFDWLAVACARRLQRRGESIEDLEQVAREGLLGAIARFDATRGTAFKSFAWATVLGSLRHYYRSRWQVRVPRALQEMNLAALRAIEELTAAAGRAPTVKELAAHLNTNSEDVLLALEVGHAYRGEPIDSAPDEHEHASRVGSRIRRRRTRKRGGTGRSQRPARHAATGPAGGARDALLWRQVPDSGRRPPGRQPSPSVEMDAHCARRLTHTRRPLHPGCI